MKHRNPAAVFFLSLITIGIYSIVWQVKTKDEMNRLGADIPTAWLLIIPIANWYWLWRYSQGVEKITGGKTSGVLAFVLLFLLGFIGMTILQIEFNKVSDVTAPQSTVAQLPTTQTISPPPLPDQNFSAPVTVSSGPVESDPPVPVQPSPTPVESPSNPTNPGLPPTPAPPSA